ncbi:MAG TPA: GNAT family N-acetyltransferase [Polyangiales bacterium]|nr:GNAT family N-acetyltransferase [Polyangiales bacterium]
MFATVGSEEPHLNGHSRQDSLLVRIRRPRAEEGSAIWDLVRRSEPVGPDARHVLPLLVSNFADTCLVAEIEGALVGFVGGYRTPTPPESVLVWQIDVDAGFREQGLGNALLHALIRCPGCAGVEYLEATVSSANVATRRLLAGFARDLDTACEVTEGASGSPLASASDADEILRVGPIHTHEAIGLERFYESL